MSKLDHSFKGLTCRIGVDTGFRSAHKTKLRWQMLWVFNRTGRRRRFMSTLRRRIMGSPLARLTIILAAAAALVIAVALAAPYSSPQAAPRLEAGSANPVGTPQAGQGDGLAPLKIKLPAPVFVDTPQDNRVANLEKPLGRARPPFLAPAGTYNAALGKPVCSSDEEPIIGDIGMITDGDKEAVDGSYVELGPFAQHVTIDLEAEHNIYAVVVWHYHKQPRVYFDVAVQAAGDPDFITNVRTIFNNDGDNSIGLGVGEDMHYTETNEGKLIDAKGVRGRYVRLYSSGNTANDLNHYTEVEVYGKTVGDANGLVELRLELPRPVFTSHVFDFSRIPNMEKPRKSRRKPPMVPVGVKNVAAGKRVVSTDKEPLVGNLEQITDAAKEAGDNFLVELGGGLESVTIDLGGGYDIYAIAVWRDHGLCKVYFDVVVQVAEDSDFTANVKTLFNNDIDNSAGLGAGKDKHYIETFEGKVIDAKGIEARYVRLYSNGNSMNDFNRYIEVEVYGKPAK
ncbi:MAG: hypothetical protein JW720_08920 [Sedimentisphaerales bacterium]|nr:hypothetical protein [Sedimentisphaerales bacterium]